MKTIRIIAALVATGALFASHQNAVAQSNVYSVNIVGYVNEVFRPGENLFCNPLNAATNTLSGLFGPSTPNGTSVSLWDYLSGSYTQSATFNSGSWSVNLTLNPGTGALLTTGLQFTNTFVGNVLSLNQSGDPVPPAPFSGTDGTHLLSSIPPMGLSGNDVFLYVLGRGPQDGEQFTWLDSLTQTYQTTTYHSALNQWDNGTPSLDVGEAGFFTIGGSSFAVPEPTSAALFLTGLATVTLLRRRASRG